MPVPALSDLLLMTQVTADITTWAIKRRDRGQARHPLERGSAAGPSIGWRSARELPMVDFKPRIDDDVETMARSVLTVGADV